MKFQFSGIQVQFNNEKVINESICVRISNLTAMLYADENHVVSYYPKELDADTLAKCITDDSEYYELHLSKEEVLEIAEYMKEKIK